MIRPPLFLDQSVIQGVFCVASEEANNFVLGGVQPFQADAHLPLFGRDPKLQSFDLGRTKEKLWSSSTFPSPITSYGYIAKHERP
jgi:hypothetical protein